MYEYHGNLFDPRKKVVENISRQVLYKKHGFFTHYRSDNLHMNTPITFVSVKISVETSPDKF